MNKNVELLNRIIELEEKAMSEYCSSVGITEILEECLDDEDKKEYNEIFKEYFGYPKNLYIAEDMEESEQTNES